jgi:hypothetical protein
VAQSLEQILDGIEGLADNLPEVRVKNVVGPDLPVSGNASVALVLVPDIPTYRATMGRGKYELDVDVLMLTSTAVDRVGQRKLAAFASQTGDASFRAAVEADPTLGGTCDTSFVASFRRLGIEEVGVMGYFGGLFTIHLATSGV